MNETDFSFTAGAAYERFMAPWSRAAGAVFLDWLGIPEGRNWLDLGCGTGAFTELLLERTLPGSVVAIDPAPAQIDHARNKPFAGRVDFRVANAEDLPFNENSFDVVVSALVLNFIPEQKRALSEMRRVLRPGGCVAAYVWDLTGELAVTRHITGALRAIKADVPPIPGIKSTRAEALKDMFEAAGFADVTLRPIEVERSFVDFDDYWLSFLENPTPASEFIRKMPEAEYEDLRGEVHASLPAASDGSVTFAARANAVKAIKPE
jgi:SAM-dependent methyltransferase